jgi:CheY-like chemotaxis protein
MAFCNPVQVLIIDDDEINNFIVERLIHRLSPESEVIACTNGAEALGFLEKTVSKDNSFPDFIFLDLRMPVLDGWGFLDEYQKRGFQNQCSVIILTSSIFRYDIDRAHEHVVPTQLISKPLTLDHLRDLFWT